MITTIPVPAPSELFFHLEANPDPRNALLQLGNILHHLSEGARQRLMAFAPDPNDLDSLTSLFGLMAIQDDTAKSIYEICLEELRKIPKTANPPL